MPTVTWQRRSISTRASPYRHELVPDDLVDEASEREDLHRLVERGDEGGERGEHRLSAAPLELLAG